MKEGEDSVRVSGVEPTALQEQPHEKTMPLGVDGKPLVTLTTRPWITLVTLGVSTLCAATLWVVHLLGNYGTATTTLDKLVASLQKGDIAALETDPELGFRDRAERDMSQRGLEEYNKILAAFQACETAGLEKYRQIQQAVLLSGEEAFKKLPADQQKAIRQSSKQALLIEHGLAEMGKEATRGVTDPGVLTDPARGEPFEITIGLAVLAERGETDLPSEGLIASWKEKPTPGQKAVVEKVREAGRKAMDAILKDAIAAGQKPFKALTVRERKEIATDSYSRWVVTAGIEALGEEDKALVTGPEMFLVAADEEVEARRLCTLVLPEHQKTLIEGRAYEDFTSKREDYVRSTGREKYARFLTVIFGSCRQEARSVTLTGDDPWDLFRVSKARIEVDWKGCPGASEYLGDVLTFRFDGHAWRFEPPIAEPAGEVGP